MKPNESFGIWLKSCLKYLRPANFDEILSPSNLEYRKADGIYQFYIIHTKGRTHTHTHTCCLLPIHWDIMSALTAFHLNQNGCFFLSLKSRNLLCGWILCMSVSCMRDSVCVRGSMSFRTFSLHTEKEIEL